MKPFQALVEEWAKLPFSSGWYEEVEVVTPDAKPSIFEGGLEGTVSTVLCNLAQGNASYPSSGREERSCYQCMATACLSVFFFFFFFFFEKIERKHLNNHPLTLLQQICLLMLFHSILLLYHRHSSFPFNIRPSLLFFRVPAILHLFLRITSIMKTSLTLFHLILLSHLLSSCLLLTQHTLDSIMLTQ